MQCWIQEHSTPLLIMLDKRFALVEKSKSHFYTVDPLNKFLEKFEF